MEGYVAKTITKSVSAVVYASLEGTTSLKVEPFCSSCDTLSDDN